MLNQILILPAHWACGIINGDTSGMEEEDETEMNLFMQEISAEFGYCVGCSEDSWFSHQNDAGTLACNVAEFYFIK